MARQQPLQSDEAYRHVLAEIRRLRGEGRKSGEDKELAGLEAAAADYAERLRARDLEIGRPDNEGGEGSERDA